MLQHLQHVLICSLGLLYGCGGFILSVFAAGLNASFSLAFDRHAHPAATYTSGSKARRRRPRIVPPRRSTSASSASSDAPLTPNIVSPVDQPLVASPSEIPEHPNALSQDYFSTSPSKASHKSPFNPLRAFPARRCSLGDDSRAPRRSSVDSDDVHFHSADERTSPFKLNLGFNKRSRTKSMPRAQTINASPSSPHASPCATASSNLQSLVKGASSLIVPKPTKGKALRKVPSIPTNQPPTLRVWPASPTLKTKHSQPLRTQPYEAPYFFPMPVPEGEALINTPPKPPVALR
ncbi:hypothetical protein ONZ45_g8984 [Pleurotus djamor]|nr:hypothetical protein ONZ45_g8984 [Pleurotus djamor]